MNPVYLIIRVNNILLINYLIFFILLAIARGFNLYNQLEFLERIQLISTLPAIIIGSYYRFSANYKTKDFSKIRQRFNENYSNLVTRAILASCLYFDVGLVLDLFNSFTEVGFKYYFLAYQVGMGVSLGNFLIPDLFSYFNELNNK